MRAHGTLLLASLLSWSFAPCLSGERPAALTDADEKPVFILNCDGPQTHKAYDLTAAQADVLASKVKASRVKAIVDVVDVFRHGDQYMVVGKVERSHFSGTHTVTGAAWQMTIPVPEETALALNRWDLLAVIGSVNDILVTRHVREYNVTAFGNGYRYRVTGISGLLVMDEKTLVTAHRPTKGLSSTIGIKWASPKAKMLEKRKPNRAGAKFNYRESL